jgi:2',3'-cyclic-nucleotide 2'-phosphodiesterase
MKILFLGDIVGKPAREYLNQKLPVIKKEENIDFVIANGENAAGGSGLTEKTAKQLFSSGIDIVTTGDHAFKKKDILELFGKMDIIRPLNYGSLAKGKGYVIKEKNGIKVGVINLLGRVFMNPVDCPFAAVERALGQMSRQAKIIVVDFHAEATSEKVAMGYFLAGKVTAVIGTHTHIPTADQKIRNGFTAYITDVGMTGSCDSVLGRRKEDILERLLTNMPVRFNLAKGDVRIQGIILDIDPETGRAISIERVEYKQEEDKENGF